MTSLTQIRDHFPPQISPRERTGYLLVGLWVLVMIALPIARWTWGDDIIPIGVTLASLVQATAVFYIVQSQWGWQRALGTFAIVAAITWMAEFIGHRTGLPFGHYHYTDALQPQVGGVPLLIPVAWFMLLPSSWVMAQMIVGNPRQSLRHRLAFIATSALALTAWDLFLDPQMVGWNFWQWDQYGAYFGIPIQNYVGWLLTAAVVTAAAQPPPLNVMPLALVYGVVWFLQSFGQALFWGQPGPAIVGSVGMGSILFLAIWRHREQNTV